MNFLKHYRIFLAEEVENGGGSAGTPPWVAGEPRTTEKQPAPGQIGISPSSVPVVVADPDEYRVPRTDEKENPVPQPVERIAEAPRLHAVEGRDKWGTLPLTLVLKEQRAQKVQAVTPVTSVTTTPATATISTIGGVLQLTTAVAPAGAFQDVTYESSAPAVATVDDKGKVTAKTEGTATITIKSFADPTKQDTTVITVDLTP